jgi:hypothetical protein
MQTPDHLHSRPISITRQSRTSERELLVWSIPNLLDNKEVFLHACATVAFALRAVADAVRTRTEKLPHYRVHSVGARTGERPALFSFLTTTTIIPLCRKQTWS